MLKILIVIVIKTLMVIDITRTLKGPFTYLGNFMVN